MRFDCQAIAASYLLEFNQISQPPGLGAYLGRIDGDDRLIDIRHIAYITATVKHETAGSFLPLEERGKGLHHSYGQPDPVTGKAYYGRGYLQLTWKRNYEYWAKRLDFDLVDDPDQVMDVDVAYMILTTGMLEGDFTGENLSDYINGPLCDYRNARRIINGLDRADLIAGYAVTFERIFSAARHKL